MNYKDQIEEVAKVYPREELSSDHKTLPNLLNPSLNQCFVRVLYKGGYYLSIATEGENGHQPLSIEFTHSENCLPKDLWQVSGEWTQKLNEFSGISKKKAMKIEISSMFPKANL